MKTRRAFRIGWLLVAAALLWTASGEAQFFREGRTRARFAPADMPDRSFTVCRLMYTSVRAEAMGMGWRTDYPYAEINLMIRLSELTRTPISANDHRDPNTYVVRLTDDALFNCPFTIASDVGTIGLTPEEATRLCACICSREASSGWTISGAREPGTSG